jgi:aminomethyltransferase
MRLSEPRKTPLYDKHVGLGARVVDFAGWWLPVQYTGILEEHRAVRQHAGLFDVSHMGEIRVKGPDAFKFLQKIVTNTLTGMKDGGVRYSPICYPSGGTVDDALVYQFSSEEYWLVVNASNKDKDLAWIMENSSGMEVVITDESDETAEVALQGPAAAEILEKLAGNIVTKLGYYEFMPEVMMAGVETVVSRTGYTGEDGFEIYCRPKDAEKVWDTLLDAGKPEGLQPAGLGCRDTLRFEASMPLYGHELSAEISPLEAGLSRFVSFEKGDFNGRDALLAQKAQGLRRKLVGFEMLDRGVARAGYPVLKNNEIIGHVTSGTFAPTVGKNLGMALVRADIGPVGTEIAIEIREKPVRAQTISRPFYKRRK